MTNILVSTVNRKDTLPSRPFDEDQTMLNVSAADVISEINRTVDFGPHEPHMMGPNNISAAGVNNSQELPPFAGEGTQHVSAEKRETTHIMPYSWQLPGTASDDGSFWTNGYTQNDVRKTTDNQGTAVYRGIRCKHTGFGAVRLLNSVARLSVYVSICKLLSPINISP